MSCLYSLPAAEPEFDLPACYKHVPQRLHAGYLSKFKDETLFYIFYRYTHTHTRTHTHARARPRTHTTAALIASVT